RLSPACPVIDLLHGAPPTPDYPLPLHDALPISGNDKTTLMVQLPDNEAGALLTMLEQFAVRGVNLSRIESRPMGDEIGRYAFSIDAEGHIDDERVNAALVGLHRVCPLVRFLGSYPRVGGTNSSARPGFTDDDFVAGREWIARMREGMHTEG